MHKGIALLSLLKIVDVFLVIAGKIKNSIACSLCEFHFLFGNYSGLSFLRMQESLDLSDLDYLKMRYLHPQLLC